MNINGKSPISCQNYNTQAGALTLNTTVSNYIYRYTGIRINTPGYTFIPNMSGLTDDSKGAMVNSADFSKIMIALTTLPQFVGTIVANFVAAEWVWVGGSDIVNASGVYGTIGIPSPDNVPGARDFSTSWTDVNGNLWLFGGRKSDVPYQLFNDLWKYGQLK